MAERRFLLSSALARLIERDRGPGLSIVEGFFPPRPDRRQVVRIEPDRASLLLVTDEGEDGAEVPRAHAEALLDVTPARIDYARASLPPIDGCALALDRFTGPGRLDVLVVTAGEGSSFAPPAWFGPEITDDARYAPAALGLDGIPQDSDVAPSNEAIESLLDALDAARPGASTEQAPSDEPVPDERTRVEVDRIVAGLADLLPMRKAG